MATSVAPATLATGDLQHIALDEAKAESPVEDVASASSTATEVRDVSSSDGEVVNADSSTPTPESPVEPFKLALPPAVETATTTALAAVQEWWATVEPLLRQLQAQMMVHLKPLLQASADGFKNLESTAFVAEWKAKLEPSTQAVIASVQQATEKVRIQAYEPALAAVIAASAAVREHAITAAELVQKQAVIGYQSSKEWWIAQQPMLNEAQAAAARHAAAALAALNEWRRQLEPLVLAQLAKAGEQAKLISEKAGEQAKVIGEKAKVAAVKLGEDGKVVATKAGAWARDKQNWVDVATKVSEETSKGIEFAKTELPKLPERVSTFTKEELPKLPDKIAAFAKEEAPKLPSRVEEAWKVCSAKVSEQMAIVAKQLEPHAQAFQLWLLQQLECLCAPLGFAPLKYKGAAQADYPPPVENPQAVVAPHVD